MYSKPSINIDKIIHALMKVIDGSISNQLVKAIHLWQKEDYIPLINLYQNNPSIFESVAKSSVKYLYRGIKLSRENQNFFKNKNARLKPEKLLESWAEDKKVASKFVDDEIVYGLLLRKAIPIKDRIIDLSNIGSEFQNEKEVICVSQTISHNDVWLYLVSEDDVCFFYKTFEDLHKKQNEGWGPTEWEQMLNRE